MPSRPTRFISVATFVALVATTPTLAHDAREADHQELRQLLATVRDAINAQQIEKLEPLVAEKFSIILADAQLVTSLKDLKAYYQRLTDPGSGVLKSLTVNPSADDLTQFLSADVGVCHGTSSDTFVLNDGTTRVLPSRWTAVLVKTNGAWKISALQVGANILDNPILDDYRRAAKPFVIASVVVGLALGAIGFVLGRRRAAR